MTTRIDGNGAVPNPKGNGGKKVNNAPKDQSKLDKALREALADGKIDNNEAKILQEQYGLTKEQIANFEKLVNNPPKKIKPKNVETFDKSKLPKTVYGEYMRKSNVPILPKEALDDPVKYLKEHPELRKKMGIDD